MSYKGKQNGKGSLLTVHYYFFFCGFVIHYIAGVGFQFSKVKFYNHN